MRVDYRNGGKSSEDVDLSKVRKVIRRDTGQEISHCFLADDQTGEWGRYLLGADKHPYVDPKTGEAAKQFGRCPLLILVEKP